MAKLPRPTSSGRSWTSFVADPPAPDAPGRPVRSLHEQGNPDHRLRVEHDASTLLLHLADEDATGWTTIVVDRATRQVAHGRGTRQIDSTRAAYDAPYET
jgi:hypothetical protein